MNVVRLYPKSIQAQIELSDEELEQLLDFLDACTVDYGKSDKLRRAGEFVVKQFFPTLQSLSEQIKGMK